MNIFFTNNSKNIAAFREDKVIKVTTSIFTTEEVKRFDFLDIQKKSCFSNAYKIFSAAPGEYKYVLGVSMQLGIPLEHALVKDVKTERYLDPTTQFILNNEEGFEFYSIAEYGLTEMHEILEMQKGEAYPPDIELLAKHGLEKDKLVTFNQYRFEQNECLEP